MFLKELLVALSLLFCPACDKDEPQIDKLVMHSEEIPTYELEPLDEDDVWCEDQTTKDKVTQELAKRGKNLTEL